MLLTLHGYKIAEAADRLRPQLGRSPSLIGGPRILTSVHRAELRSKLADVEAKLRQMTAAERNRRR